ncbi:MAG: NAD(P)/FAD-dependent oxidoreductase [Pseudomonadota bacterium]
MTRQADEPIGLDGLEQRLRQDLEWLDYPAKSWCPPRYAEGQRVWDVIIVGGGMCGLAAAGALKRVGLDNIAILDRAREGLEGPWITYARMETLRSPKTLTGPALGLPALTFRAWFEAQFGKQAWDRLGKIPRPQWMEYLVWYRRALDLPVHNGVEVTAITSRPDGMFDLALNPDAGLGKMIAARRIVLATGRDGLGGPYLPAFVHKIDRRFWAHSADNIDFDGLAGKRVAVIGAGASAMDNAGEALEAGAASLDMLIRRKSMPRINKMTGIGSQGVVHGFVGLPDEWKWRFLDYAFKEQTPPPRESTLRVSRHPNARFHFGCPITSLGEVDGALVAATPKGRFDFDFIIFGTGFLADLSLRSELNEFAPHIRLWSDRYTPPADEENEELTAFPDLGPVFEFRERVAGVCPALNHLHCFNFPATLSHGKLSGDIPAVSEGAERLARGIARSLFVEDRAQHFENLQAYDTPELLGDEWQDAEELTALHATR